MWWLNIWTKDRCICSVYWCFKKGGVFSEKHFTGTVTMRFCPFVWCSTLYFHPLQVVCVGVCVFACCSELYCYFPRALWACQTIACFYGARVVAASVFQVVDLAVRNQALTEVMRGAKRDIAGSNCNPTDNTKRLNSRVTQEMKHNLQRKCHVTQTCTETLTSLLICFNVVPVFYFVTLAQSVTPLAFNVEGGFLSLFWGLQRRWSKRKDENKSINLIVLMSTMWQNSYSV